MFISVSIQMKKKKVLHIGALIYVTIIMRSHLFHGHANKTFRCKKWKQKYPNVHSNHCFTSMVLIILEAAG